MALASGSTPHQTNPSSSRPNSTCKQSNNGSISNPNGAISSNYILAGPSSSAVFQQVKHTQASLARLSRVHQQQPQATNSQTNQSSQHANQNANSGNNNDSGTQNNSSRDNQFANQQAQTGNSCLNRSTTFVDCLIRRFKDCFNEDSFSVPMFVVGNLSPGVDGTQLILPPCVSLGRQNISRFAGPKNLRLMNSIRESCRSIEELDLGGNRLTDLIEVYKILQCTPNLRFLNLSENDLSRSSPVAMASPANQSSSLSASQMGAASAGQWQSSSPLMGSTINGTQGTTVTPTHRSCLAPISQNQQSTIGSRRHSTLGQPTIMSRPSSSNKLDTGARSQRQAPGTRLSETRRLAATAALAQSRKTSSALASKMASSANLEAAVSSRRRPTATTSNRLAAAQSGQRLSLTEKQNETAKSRLSAASSSTMHLARSLSSLSAKDIRGSVCRTISTSSKCSIRSLNQRQGAKSPIGHQQLQRRSTIAAARSPSKQQMVVSKSSGEIASNTFNEPIDESEDVEMGIGSATIQTSGAQTTNSAPGATKQPIQTRQALVQHTGSNTISKVSTSNQSTTTTTNFRRTFRSLKALALNNTGCQWRVVCSILSRMPNLEELHLSLNNYERIDLDPSEFRHNSLRRLYLCNNPKLTNWQELNKLLMAFPSLEALSIADCNISQIPDNLDRASEWRKLCGLNINGWPIKEWPVIERLNQLPSLIDLKCRNLELLQSIDEPRHHLIARLPKLQRLNGSEIEERDHAEKVFLRFFMENSHLERPSRFHELIEIHGELPPLSVDVDVDLSPPSHARVRVVHLNRNFYRKENEDDVLISEDFLTKLMDSVEVDSSSVGSGRGGCNMDTDDTAQRLFKDEGQEVVAIYVDLRQSVRKFKTTLAQIFGLSDHSSLVLYYIDHEMVGLMGPELIKHNQKKLWNYNVQDGDQFIVEER